MPHVGISTARMRTSVGAWGCRVLRAARRARTGVDAPENMIIAKARRMGRNGAVCMVPYLILLYSGRGFGAMQIGVLCALRPWVSAPAGNLVVAAADAWGLHRAALVGTFLAALAGRVLLSHSTGFAANLVYTVVSEAAAAPMSVLVEAAVVAATVDDSQYGRTRMWASMGWGGMSPVAGLLIERYGLQAALGVYACAVTLALLPTCLLPLGGLGAKHGDAPALPAPPDATAKDVAEAPPERPWAAAAAGTPTLAQLEWAARASVTPLSPVLAWQSQSAAAAAAAGMEAGARRGPGTPGPELDGSTPGPDPAGPSGIDSPTAPPTARPVRPYTVLHLTVDGSLAGLSASPRAGAATPSPGIPLSILSRNAAAASLLTPTRAQALAAGSDAGESVCSFGSEGGSSAAGGEGGVWTVVGRLVLRPDVAVFFWVTLLMGIGNGFIAYLFLFLSDLGAHGTLLGLCLSANCAAEIPVFFFSGKILERVGVLPAFHLSMAAFLLRLTCYALLPLAPTPWLVLGIELLQGATFALGWTAGCVYVKRTAPRHARSTTQSVFSGLYTGIGAGVGALLAGGLYGPMGGAGVFGLGAGMLAVGWGAALCVLWWLRHTRTAHSSAYVRLEAELAPPRGLASP
ncbi:hypothetical protein ACKKBF_B20760 [Auxenochlorella protothecoides x Auxenochlorella symbiontica]